MKDFFQVYSFFWLDVAAAILFIYYGFKLRLRPPEFESKSGVRSQRALEGKKEWRTAQLAAGTACFTYGVILAIICIIRYTLLAHLETSWLDYVHLALKLVFIITVPLLADRAVGKKHGYYK